VQRAGIIVIVDGVHTDQQAVWWQRIGADVAQGEFFTQA
jgi:EAL domain-containing protein (putative c-di-GMP-specific phosphodiesterase class I)